MEQSTTVTPQVVSNAAAEVISCDDFASWCEVVNNSFVPLQVTTDHLDNFRAKIRTRAMGDVFLSEIVARSHNVERTPSLIAAGDKHYYKLSFQLAGTGILIQDGREAILQQGDMAIYDTDRPYSLSFDKDFRVMVVMFPKSLIDLPSDAVAQLTATRIAGDEGLARMVGPFLLHLSQNMERLSGHSGVRLMHNTIDLLTTVLHSELDARVGDHTHNHRAALMQEIRAYIDDHLSDPNLSPGDIAAACFISTRHLHGIFKDQGVTVSAWIRNRRLEHCRRDLADPLCANKAVSSIASRWGFTDASHFSRLFRSTFGEAPSDFRMRAWHAYEVPQLATN